MRGFPRTAFALACTAFAGCILPSRDNPYDPENALVAALRILDLEEQDGSCAALTDTGGFPQVAAVPADSHCLVLDAADSRDADGSTTEEMRYVFYFESPDADVESTLLGEIGLGESLPRLVLGTAFVSGLPRGSGLVFELEARAGKRRGHDETVLVVLDSKPVAIAPPSMVLPVGGFPWAPAQPITVVLDGSASTDLDRDELEFCWRLSPEESCVWTVEPTRAIPVPLSYGALRPTLRVRARDYPSNESDEVLTGIQVGEPEMWASGPGAATLSRIDPFRSTLPDMGPVAIVPSPAGGHLLAHASFLPTIGTDAFLYLEEWPHSGNPQQVALDPDPDRFLGIRLAPDPVTGGLWVLGVLQGDDSTLHLHQLRHWDLEPNGTFGAMTTSGGFSFDRPGALLAFPPFGAFDLLAVDGAGSAWAAQLGETALVRASTDMALETVNLPGPLRGLSARPGSDEVWAIVDGGDSARLVRMEAGGQPASVFETGVGSASALAWLDETSFWLYSADERNLLRVAAELVESGMPALDAALQAVPLGVEGWEDAAVYELDPGSGAFWLAEVGPVLPGAILRVDPDGTVDRVVAQEFMNIPVAVDPAGALWFTGAFPLYGARRGLPGASIRKSVPVPAPLPALTTGSYDWRTGGVWTPTGDGFRLIARDGRTHRSVVPCAADGTRCGGEPDSLWLRLDVVPGAEFAWAWAYVADTAGLDLRLFSVDLASHVYRPVTVPEVPDGFGAALPDLQGQPRRTWLAGYSTAGSLFLIDEGGGSTDVVSLGDTIYGYESSPVDGSLCVITGRALSGAPDSGYRMDVRRVAPEGSVTVLLSTTSLTPSGTPAVPITAAVSVAPDGNDCWVILSLTEPPFVHVIGLRDATTGLIYTQPALSSVASNLSASARAGGRIFYTTSKDELRLLGVDATLTTVTLTDTLPAEGIRLLGAND